MQDIGIRGPALPPIPTTETRFPLQSIPPTSSYAARTARAQHVEPALGADRTPRVWRPGCRLDGRSS
jgi:hypothetical protein